MRQLQAVLQRRLARGRECRKRFQGFDVLPEAARHLGHLLGPLVLHGEQPELADGVLVKELLDKHLEQLQTAEKSGGLQIGRAHVFRAVQDQAQVSHHSEPALALLLRLATPFRLQDDVRNGTVHQPVVVLLDRLPEIDSISNSPGIPSKSLLTMSFRSQSPSGTP